MWILGARNKKKWRGLKISGAGSTRIKLAKLLSTYYNTEVIPEDIWENKYPAAKYLDLARWGVTIKLNGRNCNICSWSTMGTIIKTGIQEVDRDSIGIELA